MSRRLLLVSLLLDLVHLAACAAPGPRTGRVGDLTNPMLGPDYAQWLVGPVARLATPEEVRGFLALDADAAAERFVAAFWAARDPRPATPENEALELFEGRSREADRLLSESGVRGSRTERGTLLVLFGPPEKVDFETSPDPRDPPIEVWIYDPETTGLGGLRPKSVYRFVNRGDLTVTYTPRAPGGNPGRADEFREQRIP